MHSIQELRVGDLVKLNSTGERRLSFLHIYAKIGTAGIVVERNFKKYADVTTPKLNMQYKVIFQGFPDPVWVEPWTIDKVDS